MKVSLEETLDWHEVHEARLPSSGDISGLFVLAHQNHAARNDPYSGTRISYAKDAPKVVRAMVALGDKSSKATIPNGFQSSAQYACSLALDTFVESKNVPQAIRSTARQLHPKKNQKPTPIVSVAAATAEVEPNGITVQLHRAGATKLFVYDSSQGWVEVLGGSVFTEKVQRKLTEMQNRFRAQQQRASKRHGTNSGAVQRLMHQHQGQQQELLGYFGSYNCPPVGKFYSTSKLQKVVNLRFNGLDGLLISTNHPELTAERLNSQGPPSKLGHDFFNTLHQGKREFSASAIALSR